jgi:hypothetical protein
LRILVWVQRETTRSTIFENPKAVLDPQLAASQLRLASQPTNLSSEAAKAARRSAQREGGAGATRPTLRCGSKAPGVLAGRSRFLATSSTIDPDRRALDRRAFYANTE